VFESTPELLFFCLWLAVIAALYGSVGQSGASGFVALMALYGFAPITLKATALALNILVSAVIAWQFARSGHFRWPILRPFLLGSLPAAWLGGAISLPGHWFQFLLGILLIIAGLSLLIRRLDVTVSDSAPPPFAALVAGAIIGLVSGLTGMGGGILLAPLLLWQRWASVRTTAAITAVFILLNSVLALLGHLSHAGSLPGNLHWFAAAAMAGGMVGARIGSRFLRAATVRTILALTLMFAGFRLLSS